MVDTDRKLLYDVIMGTFDTMLKGKYPYGRYCNPNRVDRRFNGGALKRRKMHNIVKIWDNHQQIIRLLFTGLYSAQEIADKTGVCSRTVGVVKNSPVVQDKLDIMHRSAEAKTIEVQKLILEKCPDALNVLVESMKGTGKFEKSSPSVMARSASEILKLGVPKMVQTETKSLHLTGDDIRRMKEEGLKLARVSGQIVKPAEPTKQEAEVIP